MNKQILFFVFLSFTQSVCAIDLLDAWHAAREHSSDFNASLHEMEAGREKRNQATALSLPQVSLTSHYAGNRYESDFGDSSLGTSTQTGDSYGYAITASLPIYDAERRANAKQLSDLAEIAEIDFRKTEQNLILTVSRVYFDLLIAQNKLTSVLAQKKSIEEQANITKKSFELGLVTINDFYEATASLDRVLSDEIIARNELAIKRNAFEKITGIHGGDLRALSGEIKPASLSEHELSYWQDGAESNNLNIQANKYHVKIAQHEVEKFKLTTAPKLELYAAHQRQWADSDLSVSGGTDLMEYNTVGVRLNVPLYTGGNRSSHYRESLSRVNRQTALLTSSYREVSHAIYQSFLAVNASVANYFALEQRVESSKKLLDASIVSRKAGLRTTADVLRADQNYHAAVFALSTARYDYLYSKLSLAAIAGNLQEKDLLFINRLLTGTA